MFDCNNLLHPFQNDAGVSQRQRIIDQLQSDAAQVDGRSLADLLHYFAQLSAGVNYYDKALHVSDWTPFFRDSLPFLLSSISKYDADGLQQKYELYNRLFQRKPSAGGLQLMLYFIYYNAFGKIYDWHQRLLDSELPVERFVDDLIRTRMAAPLKQFIAYANEAARCFGVKRIDFIKFVDTEKTDAWNQTIATVYSVTQEYNVSPVTQCEKLKDLFDRIASLFPSLLESLRLISAQAEGSLPDSIIAQGTALAKNHQPHLALIFAFISLFQKMQGELNKKKQDHLRFFYTDVLKLKPADARPDKAFVVFELQKLIEDQYEKFRIAEGTILTAGRDARNADLLFATDREMVVNEAQVADVRTFYLNNKIVNNQTYLEGVYMAPNALMADGVDKAFREEPKNWYTLGNDLSKYTAPGKREPQRYPSARLGFVLASPVLYLAEGKRIIDITLACKLEGLCDATRYTNLFPSANLYNKVRQLVGKGFYVITDDLLQAASDKGIPQDVVNKIESFLPALPTNKYCTAVPEHMKRSVVITGARWRVDFFNALDPLMQAAVSDVFAERRIFKIHLSGGEDWIVPTKAKVSMTHLDSNNQFVLHIKVTLAADKPAITFFNKDVLKDLETIHPLVKIELDDDIKILRGFEASEKNCCLQKNIDSGKRDVSFYHFFRDVRVVKQALGRDTQIDVKVCGLKNFVVQNDENVMDVNSIIYPFGTRPKIGANFYISANEIFSKNWSEFDLQFNWKDRPQSLQAYYRGYEDELTSITSDAFLENRFAFEYSMLEDDTWFPDPTPVPPSPPPADASGWPAPFHLLFTPDSSPICNDGAFNQMYKFQRANFLLDPYKPGAAGSFQNFILKNDSRRGFLRLTLVNQDFQHSRYSFVLTRQMQALGKFPDIYVGPVYEGSPTPGQPAPILTLEEMVKALQDAYKLADWALNPRLTNIMNEIRLQFFNQGIPYNVTFDASLDMDARGLGANVPPTYTIPKTPEPPPVPPAPPQIADADLDKVLGFLENKVLKVVIDKLEAAKRIRVVIPREPYTPQIDGISLNYRASASIPEIDLIHLYPFAGTSKKEPLERAPLFPTCCDEGTLYIGLNKFDPGSNLNLLFQLAEATANSESDKQDVNWSYLDSNIWRPLRKGFEVLNDGTNNLTTSGIVELALPENMTLKNSVLPAQYHWIKASVPRNSKSVCETIGIFAQAVAVTFRGSDANDTLRLSTPLDAGTMSKLQVAEPAIKSVTQPYTSFGGMVPELDSTFPQRVSEYLRHKGRAIQKWDYERLVLQEFPAIYKAKCINHTFKTDAGQYENDIPYAPGYVVLAVLPDLTRMQAGNSYEPRVPVSMLEAIDTFIARRTSPFVRFKTANPRYEKVNFCLKIRLRLGADENYYREKLQQDLTAFLAPWTIGKYDKFSFGQCVYRSDVLQFVEDLEYVDFILDLGMAHEKDGLPVDQSRVCPASPRSILIAGNIDVCIDKPVCEEWCTDVREGRECPPSVVIIDYCREKRNDDIIS